jgi:hypothetical protein
LSDLNENRNSMTLFREFFGIDFHENPSSTSQAPPRARTDRRVLCADFTGTLQVSKCAKNGFSKRVQYVINMSHDRVTIDRIGNRSIEHLQIVSTCNYSTITNSHTLQFTTACAKTSQSAVFTQVVVW